MSDYQGVSENRLYWAPDHLRVAVTTTGAVLLDLERNRYLGLAMQHVRELATLASNWSRVSTEAERLPLLELDDPAERARTFLESGLLVREPPRMAFNACSVDLSAQLASIGLQQQRATAIRPHHVVNFVRACTWSKRALRSRSLYSIASEVSDAKMRISKPQDSSNTIELVCIFRRLRPFAFESRDRCLFHALALLRFLAHYDAHATWVIGVSARPWAAHSWLQLDNWILDSSPEDVCRFTPILAV